MTTQKLGKAAAMALAETTWWEGRTDREIAEFQMLTDELCVPFSRFHEALEKTLGRPVFTHEMGLNADGLRAELFDGAPAPSFEAILDLIPEEKRIIVTL